LTKHQQEFTIQLNNIRQEHDRLGEDLTRDSGTCPLLSPIDEWEQQMITKIRVAAEAARVDVHQ